MTTTNETGNDKQRIGWLVFALGQLAILIVAGGATSFRGWQLHSESAIPPLRDKPIHVAPLYDYDFVVTDEQLPKTLARLGLVDRKQETLIGHTDHSLRFWGAKRTFDYEPTFLSGPEMLARLTDHRRFAEVYGAESAPLLIREAGGVRVRSIEGPLSSSHIDHTAACLAEIGLPLDYPLVTANGPTNFRSMVEKTMLEFDLNQIEYEWSALTMLLFLPPHNRWRCSNGQEMTFDRIADRIMREKMPRGVCAANHRLHALVMMLRVDDMMEEQGDPRIISPETRQEVTDYLMDITATFVRNQHPDGFWNFDWPEKKPESSKPTEVMGDRIGDRLIATGHVLEWWSLAPKELHPPRHVLASAGQWLVTTIEGLTDEEIQQHNSFLSHAGRALALWRGKLPGEVQLKPDP